jgi:subtilisin family serine protease
MLRILSCALLLATSATAPAAELGTIELEQAQLAQRSGLRIVETYADFLLVQGSSAQLQQARSEALQYAPQVHGYRLALPYGAAIDPLDADAATLWRTTALADGLALVQFHGPIKPHWLQALSDRGVHLIQYLHPYTYIVHQQHNAVLDAAKEQPEIRWLGAWPQSAKLPPGIDTRSTTALTVQVLTWRGAALSRAALDELGASVLDSAMLDTTLQVQRIVLPADQLPALAALAEVLSVQPQAQGGLRGEMSNQLLASNVDVNNHALPDYRGWLAGFALSGNGINVAHVDDNIDQNHPDLIGRLSPCVGSTCASGPGTEHGTHTAGIIAADGSSGTHEPTGMFLRGLGVAPGARLISQNWNPFFSQAGGMLTLMQQSRANGAVISANSWGSSTTPRGYDLDTRQVDLGTRDTDAAVPGDQPLIYVLSIMNGNGGSSSQGAPDEAKNIVSVGATRAQGSLSATLAQWRDLADVSAHGPALDGRRLPTLVAPGCSVDSTIPAPFFHKLRCGTSMASPHVSGAIALYAQSVLRRTGQLPSAALTRAALTTATRDLNGRLDADGVLLGHRPDHKQGWGQLQLDRLLQQLDNSVRIDQTHIFSSTGQSLPIAMQIRQSGQPIDIMLTWTDAPGHGLCAGAGCTTPAWNNDLNLEVTVGATTYKGNVFDGLGRAAVGGVADEKNNTEAVFFEAGRVNGAFTVTVRAANINSDALPNSAGALQQDFALYCINCEEVPIFRNGLE